MARGRRGGVAQVARSVAVGIDLSAAVAEITQATEANVDAVVLSIGGRAFDVISFSATRTTSVIDITTFSDDYRRFAPGLSRIEIDAVVGGDPSTLIDQIGCETTVVCVFGSQEIYVLAIVESVSCETEGVAVRMIGLGASRTEIRRPPAVEPTGRGRAIAVGGEIG